MNNIKLKYQFFISIASVILIFSISILLRDHIYYRSVGYIMLFMVSILAMFFEIIPVLTALILSAISWAFFYLKPIYSIRISNREDQYLMFMYLIIALIYTVLTRRIKKNEKLAQDRKEKEKVINLYNTLFNSLSHELKTPVSAIIGASDLLIDDEIILEPKNQKILLEEISAASQRLSTQINNLLNMSRLESKNLSLNLEFTHIEELAGQIVNQLDLKNRTQKLTILIPENFPFVKIDSQLIEQSIFNLLLNAFLYTPANSDILLSFELKDNDLIIIISDNGNGIPDECLPKMFTKFYRIDNSITGGTGLGLSIVKGIVDAHKGKVTVSNNDLGGAEFKLILPVESSLIFSKYE